MSINFPPAVKTLPMADDFASQEKVLQLLRTLTSVPFTVLLFDHCLTFTSEIEHIWRKRMTPFSGLFLLNRYFALSAMTVFVALYVTPAPACSVSDCLSAGASLIFAFSVVTTLAAEAMLILRVYAVYGNNKYILFLLSLVWIVHLFLQIWIYATNPVTLDVIVGFGGLTFSKVKGTLFVIPAVVFDAIVGGLLTLGLYRRSGSYRAQMPLTTLVIQDGLLYFAVVFASNVLWTLVHALNPGSWGSTYDFTPLELWSGCITTTMISRLTLNLRMYDPTGSNELTFQTISLAFRHTTGPAGQTIDGDGDY